MKKYLSFISLFIFCYVSLIAQTTQWKSYTNTNIGISDIEIDGQHIWVTGQGGIVDFDKTNGQFVVYSQEDGVYAMNKVKVDRHGYKWLGEQGLQVSDNLGNWKLLPNMNYYAPILNPQKDSTVWARRYGTSVKKFYQFSPSVFPLPSDSILLPNSLSNQYDFAVDTAYVKWTIQYDTLWKNDGAAWLFVLQKGGINDGQIIPTIGGDLYVFCQDSLFKLNGNNLDFVWTPAIVSTFNFQFHYADKNGNLWFRDILNGASVIYKYDGVNPTTYNIPNVNIPFRVDSAGHIWTNYIGNDTIGNRGLAEWNGQNWIYHNISNHIKIQNLHTALVVTAQNEIWVGSVRRGLKTDGVNIYMDSTSYVPSPYKVYKYMLDKNNRVWVETTLHGAIDYPPGPVAYWNADSARWISIPATNPYIFNTNTFTIDSLLHLWVSSYFGGLFLYDGNTWQLFNSGNSQYPAGNPCDVATRLNQEIWGTVKNNFASGVGGVYRIPPNGNPWTIYTPANSPISANEFNGCMKIYMDKLNNVWIISYLNLYKFDGLAWYTYPLSTFPQNTQLSTITQDDQYNYWITFNNGLLKWDGGTNMTPYYLPNDGFWVGTAIAIDHNNNKWITTTKGLLTFNETGIVISPVAVSSSKIVYGNYFYDANQNQVKDVNEFGVLAQKVWQTPDSVNLYSDMSGNYACYALANMPHTFTAQQDPIFSITTDSLSYSPWVDTVNIGGLDFGLFNPTPTDSLEIEIIPTVTRCFEQTTFVLQYTNKGNLSVNGQVKWLPDAQMTFVSANSVPTSTNNDTLFFDFANLQPYETRYIVMQYTMPSPNTSVINYADISMLQATIYQLMDSDGINDIILCGYDPNDKTAYPQGKHQGNISLFKDELQYLIRFQNTGNDLAYNILISDTLDSDFDLTTFRIIGASHSVWTALDETKRVISFRFYHINLPDSTHNEPNSHGYISFGIKSQTNLPDSTLVNNQAAIYFDFNPPILTNTTENILVDSLYFQSLAVGETKSAFAAKIFPNPAQETINIRFENASLTEYECVLTDIQGKILERQIGKTNIFTFSTAHFAKGMYFLTLNGKSHFVGKCILE